MRVDVDAICRDVLARGATEADLDDAVRAACDDVCDDGANAAGPVLRMIDLLAELKDTPRLDAVRSLAESEATAETQSSSRTTTFPHGSQVEGSVVTQTWSSSEGDLPPEIRDRIAGMPAPERPLPGAGGGSGIQAAFDQALNQGRSQFGLGSHVGAPFWVVVLILAAAMLAGAAAAVFLVSRDNGAAGANQPPAAIQEDVAPLTP